jgi:hypothetical protein
MIAQRILGTEFFLVAILFFSTCVQGIRSVRDDPSVHEERPRNARNNWEEKIVSIKILNR